MSTYIVTRKSDGVEVYRYGSETPIEWVGFEFATHDHTVEPEPPPAPTPPPPTTVPITLLAFRNRFTATEKATLEIAALHNWGLAANHPSNMLAASLRVSMADQRDAQYIDLMRPETRAGVQALEQYGLVGPGRATAILDTPPTIVESWNG